MIENIDKNLSERINRGEVVLRNVVRVNNESRLGAEAVGFIETDIATLQKILIDYDNYPRFFPEVRKCKILERSGNELLVQMRLSVFFLLPEYRFTLRIQHGDDFIKWHMEDGNLKDITGSWDFMEKEGGTIVVYSNRIVLAGLLALVPEFIVDTIISFVLPGVIRNLKKILKRKKLIR
jgi:hypothetical protein